MTRGAVPAAATGLDAWAAITRHIVLVMAALASCAVTAAMRLLHAGTDIAVIALWPGHEQLATAHIYLHADMNQKERAIARVTPPGTAPGRYRPPDPLLAFLDSL